MGILRYALVGNYGRYYKRLKKIAQENHKSAFLMFIDTAISSLIFGSGLQDYIIYKFYLKNFKERREYCTIGDMSKMYEVLANVKYSPFMSNKINFHKNYGKYAKRGYACYEDGFDKVSGFLNSHEEVVLKPILGLGGGEIKKIKTKDIKDQKQFYEDMKKDGMFIEEKVVQDEEWAKLSPNSTNTLRIMTTIVGDDVRIIFGAARIGNGTSFTDNFHTGGMGVLIDFENGCLKGNGIDMALNEYEKTVTNIKVDGFKIPHLDQIKEAVISAAKVKPEIHIVGWDVAITKDGPEIIEGNRGPGVDLVQVLLKRGIRKEMLGLYNIVKDNNKKEAIL